MKTIESVARTLKGDSSGVWYGNQTVMKIYFHEFPSWKSLTVDKEVTLLREAFTLFWTMKVLFWRRELTEVSMVDKRSLEHQ